MTDYIVFPAIFLDVPSAATTKMLLGPPGSEIATPGFERPDQGDAFRLWNLAPLIPEERRFSRWPFRRGHLGEGWLLPTTLRPVSTAPEN